MVWLRLKAVCTKRSMPMSCERCVTVSPFPGDSVTPPTPSGGGGEVKRGRLPHRSTNCVPVGARGTIHRSLPPCATKLSDWVRGKAGPGPWELPTLVTAASSANGSRQSRERATEWWNAGRAERDADADAGAAALRGISPAFPRNSVDAV